MKCQILFSGKNKKNIIKLSSAELAQTVVKVKKHFRYWYGAYLIVNIQALCFEGLDQTGNKYVIQLTCGLHCSSLQNSLNVLQVKQRKTRRKNRAK